MALAHKVRFTLKLSLVIGLLSSVVLVIGASYILGAFRSTYAEQADWSLRLLALGVFPLIIRNHYVALGRIHGRIKRTLVLMSIGCALELNLAAVGATWNGLTGLSLGWLVAVGLEAIVMLPTVYNAATTKVTVSNQAVTLIPET